MSNKMTIILKFKNWKRRAATIEAMQQLVWSARLENQMKDFGEQSTIIRERFLSDILRSTKTDFIVQKLWYSCGVQS